MKYVFAAIEAAFFLAVLVVIGDWATGMLVEADDVSNVVGLIGGVGGLAALAYVVTKRVEFYSR